MDISAICDPRVECVWVKTEDVNCCVKGNVLSDKMPYRKDYNELEIKKVKGIAKWPSG